MKNLEAENPPIKERWPATVSVAILLSNEPEYGSGAVPFFKELILVRKRDSGKWGLVAGGVLQGESVEETAWRELMEETNLGENSVELEYTYHEPKLVPREKKTSIGIILEARVKTKIPPEGYEPESDEIDLVKPFTIDELRELRQNLEEIYKPEFNLYMIDTWLWDYLYFKYGVWEGLDFAEGIGRGWGLEVPS